MENIKFLIVASGYNVEKYIEGCIRSIEAQTYKNYYLLWVDDCSTDDTHNQILKHVHFTEGSHGFYNYENKGLVKSRYDVIENIGSTIYDFDIIVWLDLDDQLAPNALERLNQFYQDPNCWLTYGGYKDSYGNTYTGSQYQLNPNLPSRQQDWKFIPLRSFRRELYEKLSNEDLFPAVSECYPDASMLYCLLELAGTHAVPVDEVLYNYNCSNPLNVTKRFPEKQRDEELKFIKSLHPKQPLEKL